VGKILGQKRYGCQSVSGPIRKLVGNVGNNIEFEHYNVIDINNLQQLDPTQFPLLLQACSLVERTRLSYYK
jgi:hypothetical protein